MANWAAVLMAAGLGTRMKSKLPKVLHPICGRPMVAHVARAVRDAGVQQIVVVAGLAAEQVRAAVGKDAAYVRQSEPRGTGDAVATTRSVLEGCAAHLLVINGDMPLVRPATLQALMAAHESRRAPMTLLACRVPSPDGLGRVVRDPDGAVREIVEDADLPPALRSVDEINCGAYTFEASWLWPALDELLPGKKGELYLTALAGLAYRSRKPPQAVALADPSEALGVDTRVKLAEAEAVMRQRILRHWMLEGVTIVDPATTYIDADARLALDTVLHPGTSVLGASVVGQDCVIGPGAVLSNARIGEKCRVVASLVEDSVLEPDVTLGPYSHLRGNSYIESGSRLGNFVEVNRSRLGARTRSHHFSYLGDATLAPDVNIGAGSITCNFDGVNKHPTIIEEGAFIGCDTMLVAPVRIGKRAKTGSGAVVTRDVPPETVVVGVPARPLMKDPPAPESAMKRPSSRRPAKRKE